MIAINPELEAKVRAMQSQVIPRDVVLQHVNRGKLFELAGRRSCTHKANAKPLPGEAAGAFLDGDIVVNGLSVRRIVPSHMIALQAVDSPLLKMAEEAREKKSVSFNWAPQAEWDLCWIFTRDAKIVWQTFKSGGVKAIHEAAEAEIGMEWELANIEFVVIAVLEQYKRHIETRVRIAGEMEKDGKISFLETTPSKPGMTPALAG